MKTHPTEKHMSNQVLLIIDYLSLDSPSPFPHPKLYPLRALSLSGDWAIHHIFIPSLYLLVGAPSRIEDWNKRNDKNRFFRIVFPLGLKAMRQLVCPSPWLYDGRLLRTSAHAGRWQRIPRIAFQFSGFSSPGLSRLQTGSPFTEYDLVIVILFCQAVKTVLPICSFHLSWIADNRLIMD